MRSIAVVGAGMAGLSCAQRLQKEGLDVQVFEKSRGPGGRLSSKRMGEFSIDMGAPFFEIRSPRFQAKVNDWIVAGWLGHWETVPAFLTSDAPAHAVGIPRMNALARGLAQNLKLHTQIQIQHLERRQQQWWLFDHQDQCYGPFDQVVIAIPAPQALALVSDQSPRLADEARRQMHCRWWFYCIFPAPACGSPPSINSATRPWSSPAETAPSLAAPPWARPGAFTPTPAGATLISRPNPSGSKRN